MELLVLDTNFVAQEVIDIFESLIWTERYGAYGDFELFTSCTPHLLQTVTYDYYLWNRETDWVMIVEDIEITSDFESGNKATITGRSLESILDRRILLKKTVLTGNLQQAVIGLLDENITSDAPGGRAITNLVAAQVPGDFFANLEIDIQYDSGTNLYDLIKDICNLKGIGFRITLSDDNEFIFKLYVGEDRTFDQLVYPYVEFSPNMENIINSNYLESKKTLKNVTFVEGEVKEGQARVAVTVPAVEPSGLDRRELYTDARNISRTVDNVEMSLLNYQKQLATRGDSELKNTIFTKTFEAAVETTHTFSYGVDFFMGDSVQIVNEYEIESKVRVSELVRSQSITGIDIHPTFVTIE
jgi:hypothetical protein